MVCYKFGKKMENNSIFIEKLRSSGLRPTKQRLEICKLLFNRKKTFHFTISDLSKKLIIEAKKEDSIEKEKYQSLNNSPLNYNNYAWSLMKDEEFLKRHKAIIKAIDQLESK